MMMHGDAVCNRPITAGAAAYVSRYHGEPYFFCSLECHERFELAPGEYLPVDERSPVAPAVMLHSVS
jgi:YHS domain-containing protein